MPGYKHKHIVSIATSQHPDMHAGQRNTEKTGKEGGEGKERKAVPEEAVWAADDPTCRSLSHFHSLCHASQGQHIACWPSPHCGKVQLLSQSGKTHRMCCWRQQWQISKRNGACPGAAAVQASAWSLKQSGSTGRLANHLKLLHRHLPVTMVPPQHAAPHIHQRAKATFWRSTKTS